MKQDKNDDKHLVIFQSASEDYNSKMLLREVVDGKDLQCDTFSQCDALELNSNSHDFNESPCATQINKDYDGAFLISKFDGLDLSYNPLSLGPSPLSCSNDNEKEEEDVRHSKYATKNLPKISYYNTSCIESEELNVDTSRAEPDAAQQNEELLEFFLVDKGLQAEKLFQPLTWFPSQEGQLLYAFIHGFIGSISPQFCHDKLTPAAIFIPQGLSNPIMTEVFVACGFAFMCNIDPSYEEQAKKKYSQCLSRVANELVAADQPQEWMVATMLLFCLRDKLIGELPVKAAMHLSKAINLINNIFKSRDFNIKNIKFMVESFLFNYSVLLLVGGKKVLKVLPCPFVIFDKWRRLLDMQMFDCTVSWMNNPVFGAATEAFEMAAKVSWLVCKHPLTPSEIATACDVFAATAKMNDYSKVNFSEDIPNAGREHLQASILLRNATTTACKIALYKLLNPSLNVMNDSIQKLAQEGISLMESIPLSSPINIMVSWPALVIGLCLVDINQQLALSKRCIFAAEANNLAYLRQIALYLKQIWTHPDEHANGNLDCLFGELGSMCL